jgi:Fe-S-cluster-containing dehydrogenase component
MYAKTLVLRFSKDVPQKMGVLFDQEKCSICEQCATACPPRAMEVRPTRDACAT